MVRSTSKDVKFQERGAGETGDGINAHGISGGANAPNVLGEPAEVEPAKNLADE